MIHSANRVLLSVYSDPVAYCDRAVVRKMSEMPSLALDVGSADKYVGHHCAKQERLRITMATIQNHLQRG